MMVTLSKREVASTRSPLIEGHRFMGGGVCETSALHRYFSCSQVYRQELRTLNSPKLNCTSNRRTVTRQSAECNLHSLSETMCTVRFRLEARRGRFLARSPVTEALPRCSKSLRSVGALKPRFIRPLLRLKMRFCTRSISNVKTLGIFVVHSSMLIPGKSYLRCLAIR